MKVCSPGARAGLDLVGEAERPGVVVGSPEMIGSPGEFGDNNPDSRRFLENLISVSAYRTEGPEEVCVLSSRFLKGGKTGWPSSLPNFLGPCRRE
jgi:hypothetical protein